MFVTVLDVVIAGLLLGGLYALIAMGLSLQYGVARVFINKGIDLNQKDSQGRTALNLAARNYNGSAIADDLLRAGADPKIKDAQGRTPMDLAKSPSMKKLLAKTSGW